MTKTIEIKSQIIGEIKPDTVLPLGRVKKVVLPKKPNGVTIVEFEDIAETSPIELGGPLFPPPASSPWAK